jgi:hypothetical protein
VYRIYLSPSTQRAADHTLAVSVALLSFSRQTGVIVRVSRLKVAASRVKSWVKL